MVVKVNDETVCIQDEEIELLAYDQWTGISIMPDMVSAFVTSNHKRISEVISQAGLFLQKWTGNPSFTEYQTQNPNEVKKQMTAIYAALQSQNIAYLSVPASFENVGQRIRLPYAVLEQKGGTCLDLSLLYLSCLEAIGLHGILIFIKSHAFVGCWLEDQTFMDCVQDDPAAIAKRFAAGIHKLAVLECTDFVAGKTIEFDLVEKHAKDYFIKPENFLLSVDIKRCRIGGIRPLPQRIVVDGQYQIVDYGKREDSLVSCQ
ncbi:MAG: hypothetical protein PUC65_12685 [Clostridiales bacterium]|nr:hypothetical protein [Clostridiales bacterium]